MRKKIQNIKTNQKYKTAPLFRKTPNRNFSYPIQKYYESRKRMFKTKLVLGRNKVACFTRQAHKEQRVIKDGDWL